jgi:hypothetical protein
MRPLKVIDQTFGRLKVISEERRDPGERKRKFLCQCACSRFARVALDALVQGRTKSCGCLRIEIGTAHGMKHGQHGSATYNTWASMVQRCTNQLHEDYKDYGGRGITVDPRWLKFENFFEDMGLRPPGRSLDRKKNERGYCKANCRWSTPEQQANNKRNVPLFIYHDEAMSISQWARKLGVDRRSLQRKVTRYGSMEKALGDMLVSA